MNTNNPSSILFADALETLPPSASKRDQQASITAATLMGFTVYTIPPDFTQSDGADNALWQVPTYATPTPAFWAGYIPTLERYSDLYQAAKARNIFLANTPEEHQRIQEFDHCYPFLQGLTPKTAFVTSESECAAAIKTVGLPVFVKGAVQSRKSRGWKACVAETEDELKRLVRALLTLEGRSRGRVMVRELVELRHVRYAAGDFPVGREYRVFLWQDNIVGMGYYWDDNDAFSVLTPAEEAAVRQLAQTASSRLQVPFVAVDIGQKTNGEWIVIETGDPQFSGLSQINVLSLWNNLKLV
jgi:glutathione synthase/RimK-type ligase-like ATP-grasp enzyme